MERAYAFVCSDEDTVAFRVPDVREMARKLLRWVDSASRDAGPDGALRQFARSNLARLFV
jgi:hypothetical protein